MSYATGSQRYLALTKEVVPGTTPANVKFKKIRNTGGSGVTNERSALESAEIRSDRGIADFRLGPNNPAAQIPIEFVFDDHDDLLEGAMGSAMIGGRKYTISVNYLASPVGAIDRNDTGNWKLLGFQVGDYIVISGSVTAGHDMAYKIASFTNNAGTNDRMIVTKVDGSAPSAFTPATADSITIRSGWKGGTVNAVTNTCTVNATGKTYTAATALWMSILGFQVGDIVYFQGFTQAGNNGWKKITTLTDTILTAGDATGLVNETKSTTTFDAVNNTGVLVTGTAGDIQSFTFEEGFTSVSAFHNMKGAKVDSFSLNCQPGDIVKAEFGIQGISYSGFVGATISVGGLENPSDNSPFDSYSGALSLNGGAITEATAIIAGANFNISNGLEKRQVIMSNIAAGLGEGRVKVTGSLSAFFTGATIATLYNTEAEIDLSLKMIDLDGNAYIFNIPRLKFTKDARTIKENDVSESLDFQALIDANGVTMKITKQPKI